MEKADMSRSTSINGCPVEITDEDVDTTIARKVEQSQKQGEDDAFYVVNLNEVVNQYELWGKELRRVEPFYAVKCNHDPAVLGTLARLGTGFECANKGEIEKALQLGVPPSKILYGNPCKQISHLCWARDNNVSMVMFDNEAELVKTRAHYPNAELIMRINPEDVQSFHNGRFVGQKFGASKSRVRHLLSVAKQSQQNIVGVSFYVGISDKYSAEFICSCVKACYDTFKIGKEMGFTFRLLDIGGGFRGHDNCKHTFKEVCAALNPCLDEMFPESSGVRIIAEPGRYSVTTAFTLTANVIARRPLDEDEMIPEMRNGVLNCPRHIYFINIGTFHTFYIRDIQPSTAFGAVDVYNPQEFLEKIRYSSIVCGPTMAASDIILHDLDLPELAVGDWLVFKDLGAYSIRMFSNFSSCEFPKHCYIIDGTTWAKIDGGQQKTF